MTIKNNYCSNNTFLIKKRQQAEAEVVPSSSLVDIEVEVDIGKVEV